MFPDRGPALVPTSLRFSRKLLERIDRFAAAKGVTRTETIEKLVNPALDALAGDGAADLHPRRRPVK